MSDATRLTPQVRTKTTMNDTPRSARLRIGALAAGALVFLSACASDAPQDTWKPAGDNAQAIQDLQWWVFLIAGIVGVIVIAAVTFIVVKYRDRGQPIP